MNSDAFNLGQVVIKNNLNNNIITYDKERTVCDIIRSKERIKLQVYTEVIQNYFEKKPNMNKLIKYAKALNVIDEVYEISILLMKG